MSTGILKSTCSRLRSAESGLTCGRAHGQPTLPQHKATAHSTAPAAVAQARHISVSHTADW